MKKIVFLTGTRADWGKLKSLIAICKDAFDIYIFASGMHMDVKHGRTIDEVIKCGYNNIFPFYNHSDYYSMSSALAKTIDGLSNYLKDIKPDLICVHGDRVEALAGAIAGNLNNILVAHIEGGEVSGSSDESMRHSTSKMAHLHFVSNEKAKQRLIQMGENIDNIFVIGSPSLDIILSDKLPQLSFVKKYYSIDDFKNYSMLLFHPVTTELSRMPEYSKNLVDAILRSELNYIIVNPNNDIGNDFIASEYRRFEGNKKIKIFPSLRFEYYLTLLKNCDFIIGNSSSGIMEAPYYEVPTINIGTRQNGRIKSNQIINCGYEAEDIYLSINKALDSKVNYEENFGTGNSDKIFFSILKTQKVWNTDKQKKFIEL